MSFEGEVALVTGGAGGLGAATVRRLHAAGASVVIADLADQPAKELAEELGERAIYARTDVLDDDSVNAALEQASELGDLRYAVIAHGGFGVAQKIVGRDGSPADMKGFVKTLNLYLTGTYNVLRLTAAKFAAGVPYPKRLGLPDEFAALAQHLLENSYINGEIVRLDGAQRFQPR